MLKILYHAPNINTVYAGRTINNGYKNAFVDMRHSFIYFTLQDRFREVMETHNPDIFFTSLNNFYLKQVDIDHLKRHKRRGLKVFVNIPFWKSPLSGLRMNETPGLSSNDNLLRYIVKDNVGDVYYNVCEPEDERMQGFEEVTGYKHYTIPLAADKTVLKLVYDQKFKADISFIGTLLPEKRRFFKEHVYPLRKSYDVRLYGQDWTLYQRIRGWIQRGGQYFNIPYLRDFNKPKLQLEDEAKIYNSSVISINVHEDYQKKYGGDCNERTFKIPLAGGFEITDDVACIRKYFKEGEEIIIAKDKKDWFEKIDYYMKNPEKRLAIIEAGRRRVLAEHTYHNRVERILEIYKTLEN